MIALYSIVLIGISIVNGQSDGCCYNQDCAYPLFSAWSVAFNLTNIGSVKDSVSSINPATCCPSGGNVLGNYNGVSSLSGACRCHDGTSFIDQTCPYLASDAYECSDVGSDTGCPDMQSQGGRSGSNGVYSCIDLSNHYIPQRCPSRAICLDGTGRWDGNYYTNSTLWNFGYSNYLYDSDYLGYSIAWQASVQEWWLLQNTLAYGKLDTFSQIDPWWDIVEVQRSWTVYSQGESGWVMWDDTLGYVESTTASISAGACPTTATPTESPTKVPSISPTTAAPTISPTTAAPTSKAPTTTSTTTTKPDNGNGNVQRKAFVCLFTVIISIRLLLL